MFGYQLLTAIFRINNDLILQANCWTINVLAQLIKETGQVCQNEINTNLIC